MHFELKSISVESIPEALSKVERYRLLNGGNQLSVTFTWEDPNVFAKPHTYEFRYYRAPKGTNARNWSCDPFDEERARFLTK